MNEERRITELKERLAHRQRKDVNGIVYSHPLYSTVLGILGRQILPLLANCHFIKSGIRVFDVPRYIGNSQTAELMINELGSSVALLLRGSGLVTVAENIQEATLLSILIERSAKVQYMASAIGDPKSIVAADMPGKFGSMPTLFFESSWDHYVSTAS